jgi:hypothetical protein
MENRDLLEVKSESEYAKLRTCLQKWNSRRKRSQNLYFATFVLGKESIVFDERKQ